MNRNIKRHIKTILSVIGLFSLPILLYFLLHYLGLQFVLFVLIAPLCILAIINIYGLFYDEFE